ncbi:hypothetical protein [Leifsonia aquatica]|uniref:hypothetical protein n=1 Tax=Leifsonia aquatica TaxID=144185 RepID=UPI0037F960DA
MPDALDLDPPERRVAVAGDWHRNQLWIEHLLPELARQSPGTRTILQLGDFGLSPDARKEGDGPAFVMIRGCARYRPESVEAWITA